MAKFGQLNAESTVGSREEEIERFVRYWVALREQRTHTTSVPQVMHLDALLAGHHLL
jgi:hypothetical protein